MLDSIPVSMAKLVFGRRGFPGVEVALPRTFLGRKSYYPFIRNQYLVLLSPLSKQLANLMTEKLTEAVLPSF